ncbi:MAG: hypothetical protein ACLQJR_16950 [Stellaceae bacterium]
MRQPIRILLQTTIVPTEDDWSIARFGLLRDHLAALRAADGTAPLCVVTARDRAAPPGQDDPVLAALDGSDFDELWLFAVDTGDGLTAAECDAVSRFRARGGGLLVTRDHADLGCSVCRLGGVGLAHHFHSHNPNPDEARRRRDDPDTLSIDWPNYHSGANGDFQEIVAIGKLHPLLRDRAAPDGSLRFFPAHPHEGDIAPPPGDAGVRIIAEGRSKATGRAFNTVVAFAAGPDGRPGAGVAQSTFHHFCDYNWDIARGCPSFVAEPPGDGMRREPAARRAIETYTRNLALWLAGINP